MDDAAARLRLFTDEPHSVRLRFALTDALSHESAIADTGLRVKELIELIAQYLTLLPLTVSSVKPVDAPSRSTHRVAHRFSNAIIWMPPPHVLPQLPVLVVTDNSYGFMEMNISDALSGQDTAYALSRWKGAPIGHYNPLGICVLPKHALQTVFVTDCHTNVIRGITSVPAGVEPSTACSVEVTFVVGANASGMYDGKAQNALFDRPDGLVCSPDGEYLYVADCNNQRIRRVELSTSEVTTLVGNGIAQTIDGDAKTAAMIQPHCIALCATPDGAPDGALYVCGYRQDIRRWDFKTKRLSTVTAGLSALPSFVKCIAAAGSSAPTKLFLATDYRLWKYDVVSTELVMLAGCGLAASTDGEAKKAGFSYPTGLVFRAGGTTQAANGRIVSLPDELFVSDGRKIRVLAGSILDYCGSE